LTIYESTFVVDGKVPEAEVEKLSDRFKQLITSAGGEILKTEKLGKRELSYKVGNSREGCYVYIEANMDGKIVKELERNYRITDSVLRFLTIKKEFTKPIKKRKKAVVEAVPKASASPVAPAAPVASSEPKPE
jgi:small subunit ribosomal protein S6